MARTLLAQQRVSMALCLSLGLQTPSVSAASCVNALQLNNRESPSIFKPELNPFSGLDGEKE